MGWNKQPEQKPRAQGERYLVRTDDNTGQTTWLVKSDREVTCNRCGQPFLCWVKSAKTGRFYLCGVWCKDVDGLPIGCASVPHKCSPERVQMWTDFLAEQTNGA